MNTSKISSANNFLSATLAICLLLEPFAGGVATASTATSAVPVEKTGQSYLSPCADLFHDLRSKPVEEVFLSQIQNQDQMRQLLFDYSLLLTNGFYNAVSLALNKRGILVVEPLKVEGGVIYSRKSLEEMRAFILQVRDLAQDRAQLKAFVWEVAEFLLDGSNKAQETLQGQERVEWEQKRQLLAALRVSEKKHVFEAEMTDLVEQILLSSVVRLVERWSRASRERDNLTGSLTVIGATALAAGAFTAKMLFGGGLDDNDIMHLVGGTITSALAVVAGGALGFGIEWIADESGDWSPVRALFRGISKKTTPKPEIKTYQTNSYNSFGNYFIERGSHVAMLWDGVSAQAFQSRTALSIEEACTKNLCQMTPVQIAYAGHLDLLEIKVLNENLRAALLGDKGLSLPLQALSEQARRLDDTPHSYSVQFEFIKNFRGILQQLRLLESDLLQNRRAVEERIQSLSQRSKELSKNVYSKITSEMGPAEVAKGELLLARVETDLKALQTIQMNNRVLDKKAENLSHAIGQLYFLEKKFPGSRESEGWKKIAEEVLLVIDQVRAMQIGSSK